MKSSRLAPTLFSQLLLWFLLSFILRLVLSGGSCGQGALLIEGALEATSSLFSADFGHSF